MLSARQFVRSAPRYTAQLRATAQRRFASSGQNEFISERQHIKEHAQGTTGKEAAARFWSIDLEMMEANLGEQSSGGRSPSSKPAAALTRVKIENRLLREIASRPNHDTPRAGTPPSRGGATTQNTKGQWADDVNSAVIPAMVLASANAYFLWKAHWEHWDHMPALEERTEYPYQNIRTKNFQWGDGDKTLL